MTESFEIVETTSLEIIDTSPTAENISIFSATFQNFHKICRFCLGSDNLKPFFDMTYNQTSVQNIIYDCCSLKVNPEDCLPCNLCETCITELIRIYRFKTRCIQVSSVLQDAYDNRNFTIGSEETIQSYDENDVNLNIKREEIEDPLSIHSDSTSGDLATIHSENIFADNLIIENEAFQNVVETYKVNIVRDINCAKLRVKDLDAITICNDNISEGCDEGNASDCKIVKVISSDNLKCNEMVHWEENKPTLHRKTTVLVPHSRSVCRKPQSKKLKPKTHTGKTAHKCSVCKETFVLRSDLGKHILLHKGEKLYKCSVCEKSFTRKPHLKAHSLIHTSERPHKCNVCNQSFRQKYSLKTHMLLHKDEKPHKCNVCEKSFTQKGHLNAHMLVHAGERPHKCEVCNQSFTVKYTLQTHMLRHADEKPYKCSVCERCFNYKSNLMTHMLFHEGEKPHKCSVCEKSFTRKTHLSRHLLIHTGERPHKCNICNRAFTMKYNLDTHVLRHAAKTQ